MNEKLLTLKEASEYLGIPENKIRSHVESGELPAYKLGGMHLRFKLSQLEGIRFKFAIPAEPVSSDGQAEEYSLNDRIKDFFYFNDFYVVSTIIILLILVVIFKSK